MSQRTTSPLALPFKRFAAVLALGLAAAPLLGCDGVLGGAGSDEGGDPSERGQGADDGAESPSASTRFRRLTHVEWERSSMDLLKVDLTDETGFEISSLAGSFRSDPRQGGFLFESNGDSLKVDSSLWSSYQRAAQRIAEAFVRDSEAVERLSPSDGVSDEERAERFIELFGARAHRRPLTSEQKSNYLSLYQQGVAAYDDTSGYLGGLRLLIEAFLQSPHFIYRVEESAEVVEGIVPLDGFERAARLSYFFWNSMPDDALFAAAQSGDLDTAAGVREQAERLVANVRASDTVVRYFEKVLDVERYEQISPSSTFFPEVTADLPESALTETQRFIRAQVYEESGSLRDLLTSTKTYVDSELAEIYGLQGDFGEEFEEVELDPDQRAGVLTQIGFLAGHATSSQPDPIHRGVFVAKRINCIPIAAPPDDVPPLPTPAGQSNRDLVAEHTEVGTCKNCHETLINPYGFAFENYDAVGGYRTEDGEHPVNASAEISVDDGTVPVSGALDLSYALAESSEVHKCFSRHLVAYAQGRKARKTDEALVESLGAQSLGEAISFRELMVEMAVAISFLNRSVEAN